MLQMRSSASLRFRNKIHNWRRYQAQFTYKQVFNGLSVTLTGSDAQQAQAVAALKALPQVVSQLPSPPVRSPQPV